MKKIAIGITSILSAGCLMSAILALNPATASANTANISMVDGASVRLSSYKSGIGFTTRVNYDYYNTLDESYDVITGTLILPTDYLTDNGITEVTHATLTEKGEAGVFFQDVVNQGWKNTATAEKDGYYEYRGSLVNLNKSNYDREFSAVGYVGYKTESDAEYTYEYTAYDMEKNSRAIDDVAFKAYVDRTAKEETVDGVDYKYAVEKDGTYSRYTSDELGILSGYMRTMSVTAGKTAIVQDEDGSLDYTALKALATDSDFNANAITSATRNGKNIEFTNSAVDVSLNGVYNVTLNGEATHTSGAIVPATYTMNVDVWSEATKNIMIAVDDIYVVGGYTGQGQSFGDYSRGTYIVGGRTGRYYRSAKLGAAVAFGKPLHTKEYYEQWLEANPYAQSYISIDWYFDNPTCTANGEARTFDRFSGFTQYLVNDKFNTWFNGTKDLSAFLNDDFAGMSSYFDTTMAEIAEKQIGRFSDGKGVVDANGNLVYDYILATKIDLKIDNVYLSDMTIELGDMKTIETTELVDRTKTSSIDPSLTASEQEVVTYWENNGYSISYEFVKRYSDGTPIATANAVTSLASYTIDETVEDGIYFLNVVATKGETTGTCLIKSYDIYNSTESIVEFENFKHTDSKYAIRIYWAKFSKQAFTYEATTFNIQSPEAWGATLDNVDFGEGTDENTLYILSQNTTTLNSGSNSQTAVNDTNYSGREVGYIAYSWASQDTNDKLQYAHSNGAYYQYIYTYILPRHSLAYYEAFADKASGTFEMLYKSTDSNKSGLGRMRYMYPTNIVDGKISMAYTGNVWSSNNQPTNSKITMNINTIIDNYDAFANCKVPMLVMMHMAGTTTSSAESRLYEMGFHKTVNS